MTSTRTGPIPLPESVTNAISSITDTATEVAQNAQQLAREKAARDMVDSIGDSISEAIADPGQGGIRYPRPRGRGGECRLLSCGGLDTNLLAGRRARACAGKQQAGA